MKNHEKQITTSFLFVFLLTFTLRAQKLVFTKEISQRMEKYEANNALVKTDDNNNVYVASYNEKKMSACLIKYNSKGDKLWLKVFKQGNVLSLETYQDKIIVCTSNEILKMNGSKIVLWRKKVSGIRYISCSIASNGDILLFGRLLDHGFGKKKFSIGKDSIIQIRQKETKEDCFYLRMNEKGELINKKYFPNIIITDVISNHKSKSYLTGYFLDSARFSDSLYRVEHNSRNYYPSNLFVGEFDETKMSFSWVKTISNENNTAAKNLSIDNNGDLILMGMFEGEIDVDPSSLGKVVLLENNPYIGNSLARFAENYFLLKLTNTGEYIESLKIGKKDDYLNCFGFILDKAGNVNIFGNYEVFHADIGNDTLTKFAQKNSWSDGSFIARIKNDLSGFKWVSVFQHQDAWDTYPTSGVTSVVFDSSGYVFAVGYFDHIMDFDPSENIHYMGEDQRDIRGVRQFLLKLAP